MELVPILEHLEQNGAFAQDPVCTEGLIMTVDYYKRIGFKPPWIGYFVRVGDVWAGSCGFKGAPVGGRVEIAYGTFPKFRSTGVGTEICRKMVQLALEADPSVRVCARTLPESNHSARILLKNGFENKGMVVDLEDGEVWEWEYRKVNS